MQDEISMKDNKETIKNDTYMSRQQTAEDAGGRFAALSKGKELIGAKAGPTYTPSSSNSIWAGDNAVGDEPAPDVNAMGQ